MKIYIFLHIILVLFLVGCTSERIIEKEVKVPVYENVIKEVQVNNTVYLNGSKNCSLTTNTITVVESNSSYVLSLIKRIKFLEGQQSDYLTKYENISNCERDLGLCNDTLVELRGILGDN